MKRIISLCLLLAMVLTMLPVTASAVEAASGTCGDGLYWVLDTAGNLTISGNGAMMDCSNGAPWEDRRSDIQTIYIGDGVTSIGNYAFVVCENLTSVTIGNGVTDIGDAAFATCKKLKTVTFGNSVRTIGQETFSYCTGLLKVELPDSVTTVGKYAFQECWSMNSLTISKNLTSIPDYAFSGNSILTDVVIPASVTFIDANAFTSGDTLKNVYFEGDAPSVKPVAADFWLQSFSSVVTLHYVPGTSGWTDSSAYDASAGTWNGYKLATWAGSQPAPEEPAAPGISAQIAYNGANYDLLSQWVNIEKGSSASVTVTVNRTGGSDSEKIYITQNTENAVELQNGVAKTFQPGQSFRPNQDIYILVVNEATGEAVTERTTLKIVEKTASGEWNPDSGIEGANFKLFKGTSFTVPDTVPVFNGTEIKLDLPSIPISVEYDREDNNKVNVVFGVSVVHGDGENARFFKDFDFKALKKSLKDSMDYGYRKLKRSFPQLKGDYKKTKDYKMNLFGGKVIGGGSGETGFDADVLGYAEMKFIDGKPVFIEGQLCLEVEASYTYQGQLFIWAVPIYYEIGGGVGGGLEGNLINIDPETYEPKLEAYLTNEIKAQLGTGLGVAKVATVGVAGEGSLNLKSALHKDYLKCWGEGNANFNIKIAGREVASRKFAEGDFLIYETGNANGMISDGAVMMAMEEGGLYASIDKNGVYDNESRNYDAQWYGDLPPIAMFDLAYTNEDLQLLAEDTYTEAAPQMSIVDGQKVMVMLWDGEERTDANRTMAAWSVYDDLEKTWSQPQPVWDDGTADFYPNFKDGWLVWQNETSALTDDMTLAEIAALGEISLTRWNGAGFDAPVTLTDNDTLDTLPAVCSDGTDVTVAWVNNSENDILGLSGINTVQTMTLGGEMKTLASGTAPVTALAAGSGQIAYVLDGDSDLETIADWELYLNGEKLTENDVLDSNPVFVGDMLYYYAGGNICAYEPATGEASYVFAEAAAGLTDAFTAAANEYGDTAIWWSGSAEGGTEIFCALKKDGVWTAAIRLTEMDGYCRYPTGVMEVNGDMYLALANSFWGSDSITKNDLYTLHVIPGYDLAMEDVYVDEANMIVYGTVRNVGQLNVDSYTICLRDGVVNNRMTIREPLKAGEAAEVELAYIVPQSMSKRTISFEAALVEGEEFDLTNNAVDVSLGSCDVEVQEIEVSEGLPLSGAVATIANVGFSDAGAVTVQLREGREDGTIVAEQTLETLAAGERKTVSFEYDVTRTEDVVWYVTAVTEDGEMSTGNNAAYFINTCKPPVHVCVFDQEVVKAETLKTEADCENAAVYYKSCTCGEISETETFTYGSAKGHTPSDWQKNDTEHWKNCTVCPEEVPGSRGGHVDADNSYACDSCGWDMTPPHVCAFDQEVVKAETLKSEADCENAAVYYKSCTCGEISETETFVYGSASGHTPSDWQKNDTEHWKYCTVCTEEIKGSRGSHGKGKCDTCGYTAGTGGISRPNYFIPVAPAPQMPFADVSKSDWFYEAVQNAWKKGLINGVTATSFRPNETLTVAQAIKLAAALHQMQNNGRVTLTNGSVNWYDTYVRYAVENGIIERGYAAYTAAQMNTPVSRREFVHIFYGAMDRYTEQNHVADNAIPDVKMGDKYAAEIYTFYRAGILTGNDAAGTFAPASSIKRSEVAAILSRMYQA